MISALTPNPAFTCCPIGFREPKHCLTSSWLTITVCGAAAALSGAANTRPATERMRIVSRYPGDAIVMEALHGVARPSISNRCRVFPGREHRGARHPGRLHAGNGPQTFERSVVNLMAPVLGVTGSVGLEDREKDAPAVVPAVEGAEVCEAPREQRGARQQHQRQRDLRRHERPARHQTRPASDNAGAFLQHGIELRTPGLKCRKQPEQESRAARLCRS